MTPESAITAEIKRVTEAGALGQVAITPLAGAYELRHVQDKSGDDRALRKVSTTQLRELASLDAKENFRPLKSAPDLTTGWRHIVTGATGLKQALDIVYPGWLADTAGFTAGVARLQSWAEFSSRQTGIYQKAATLGEDEIARIVSTCCSSEFCMRRPVWHSNQKTGPACIAPCAVLLEFARFVAGGSKTDPAEPADGAPAACEFSNPSNPHTRKFLTEGTTA